jgi:histidine triad (HIT) family protein
MATDCLFCKIVSGEIPSEKEYETDNLLVIKDIHPKAPTHLLIIPKVHVSDIIGLSDDLWVEIKKVALELADKKGLKGFRLVSNAGTAAAVAHMHMHLLGEIGSDREI